MQPRPTYKTEKYFESFNLQVRRTHYFYNNPREKKEEEEEEKEPYVPLFHRKSEWEPESCDSADVEEALEQFKARVTTARARFMKSRPSNLRPSQFNTIERLQDNDEVIVIEADKNLGACTMMREEYMKRGVEEHLGNKDVYKKLDAATAGRMKNVIALEIRTFVHNHTKGDNPLSNQESYWLLDEVKKLYEAPLPKFRMMAKIHKPKLKMRPIVCCAGSLLNSLSKWLDYQLKKLLYLCPCYLRDSNHLLYKLRELGQLPPGAKVFCADAKSMYTYIDFDHAIEEITIWLRRHQHYGRLPRGFPVDAVLDAMRIVMKNNLFQWGDCFFLQIKGTAMGTSSACMWATIYYAVHECELISIWQDRLLTFHRFIDDMFGIWIPDTSYPYLTHQQHWEEFVSDLPFGELIWEDIELGNRLHFLDLWITIDTNNHIVTETYQKELNLYQYIPPASAHPHHMMKGIIYSLMRNYKLQNTHTEDYYKMAKLLFQRHVARGWKPSVMKEYIRAADRSIRLNPPQLTAVSLEPQEEEETEFQRDCFYLPWVFHPNDIPRQIFQKLFQEICADVFEEQCGINKLTVAYSRQKNIREELTKAKLYEPAGKEASTYFTGESTTT